MYLFCYSATGYCFPVAIICTRRTKVHVSAQRNVKVLLSTNAKRHAGNQKIKYCSYICGLFQSQSVCQSNPKCRPLVQE